MSDDIHKALNDSEGFERDRDAEIAKAGVPTEAEMRKMKAPWPKTMEELTAYIKTLTDRPHTYGTCVYAMSLAAVAAFQYASEAVGGCTGFQASCADLDILRQTRGFDWGKILNYENLLYPQYLDDDHFPSWQTLLRTNAVKLGELAAKKLAESPDVHPNVVNHWRRLVDAGEMRGQQGK